MIQPLQAADLYRATPIGKSAAGPASEPASFDATIGQQRALESINLAVGMRAEGYNAYVMGETGLGRHTLIQSILREIAAQASAASDWCYVANFEQPYHPRIMCLPPGVGRRLQRHMDRLVEDLIGALSATFQSDEYRQRAQEINDAFKQRQEQATERLNRMAREKGLTMVLNPAGYTLAATHDGKILTNDEFDKLPEDRQKTIEADMAEVEAAIKQNIARLPEWQKEMQTRLRRLRNQFSELTVAQLVAELEAEFSAEPAILEYLGRVRRDIVENVEPFLAADGDAGQIQAKSRDKVFNRYRVNLLVDNTESAGAPIVYEDSPTYQNLLGRIEHTASMGTLSTDFTLIKPGALHRANGGYLILDATKVLSNPFAWEVLKRALGAAEIRIESLERRLSLISTMSLEPEPVPLSMKVVLIGDRYLYYLLKAYDPEFARLFKVAVDFAQDMPRSEENEALFGHLLDGLQARETLRPLSAGARARATECSARRSRDRDHLSLNIGTLLDLLRESDYWAARAGADRIEREHVQTALDKQLYRVDQLRERIQASLLDGTLQVGTDGVQLAQVNGLALVQLGDYAFGMPTRISATARMGAGELIDIERESDQGGTLHSKGVLILASYLAWRYAKNQPLSVAASLVFEQTYGTVEGDSASAAELCALLSALADIPLRQSMAITGSVSQHGEVQAIGGVCEKIEGYFEVCQARGLSGDQGVIIPRANLKDLMLREDLRRAVAEREFRIYAVRHVEEAMELLSGMDAGRPDANGLFPATSINGRIQTRLAQWTALRQHFANPNAAAET